MVKKNKKDSSSATAGRKTVLSNLQLPQEMGSPTKYIYALVAIGVLVFFHQLTHPFIWDDEVQILGNQTLINKDFFAAFTTGLWGESLEKTSYYRPLTTLSYLFDVFLGGGVINPLIFHITSLCYHLFGVIFLFLFLRLYFKQNLLAWILSLLYCVHPLQTSDVDYVSGRAGILALSLGLFALYQFQLFLYNRKKKQGIMTILAYLLSLFSKETLIGLPFILWVLCFFQHPNWKNYCKKTLWFWISIFWVLLMFLIFRYQLQTQQETRALSWFYQTDWLVRLSTFLKALVIYAQILFFPYHYHYEYLFIQKHLLNTDTLLVGLFTSLLGYIFYKFQNSRKFILGFGIIFAVLLAPISNLFIILPYSLQELWARVLLIPCLLMMGMIYVHLKNTSYINSFISKKIITVICACYIMYFIMYTYERGEDFSSAKTLYAHDLQYAPDSYILSNNLGVEDYRINDIEHARALFKKSIALSPPPGYAPPLNNLALIYMNESDTAQAIPLYLQAINTDNYQLAYENLALLYGKYGKLTECRSVVYQGLQIYPNDPVLLDYAQQLQKIYTAPIQQNKR
ncbi:MAG: hypothetical protein QM528_03545 [Phycisphaerales bacterium]|nr:hypothetical protein [Phycisphaerales bacterium]